MCFDGTKFSSLYDRKTLNSSFIIQLNTNALYDMSNVQKIQAQSFSTLTQLADDPPRYVRVATDREPLKLYIVRVPASQGKYPFNSLILSEHS